ncbi:MAG: ABC transporter ATP-binding protein [Propioniciclava sp.]
MGPVIRAEHLSFGYSAGAKVLDDLTFEVSAGEVLMVLGANGCGKSTLLRVLLGERRRLSGTVTLDGDDVNQLSTVELARRVAMVFQDHHAPFPFSAIDVVTMGRTPHLSALGLPSRKDRDLCREALDTVGMGHLASVAYTEISGGERQLVLIARALAQQTPLIMMDEPTSHLDYRNAATVIKIAHQLAEEQNKAIIMVTHLPDQAFYYPTKTALMKNGRFFAYGPSREVLTEDHLRETYNMHIKVLTAPDPLTGVDHIMCKPVLERL